MARQGYYIKAASEAAALEQMAQLYPDDDAGFTAELWKLDCPVCRAMGQVTPRSLLADGEGFWSLLRSWLRPHRGISQEKLPLYLGCFEFVYNARKQGKALLGALLEVLLT